MVRVTTKVIKDKIDSSVKFDSSQSHANCLKKLLMSSGVVNNVETTGLLTWTRDTPDRIGNPLSWGNPPNQIISFIVRIALHDRLH